jgi:hypothetical protein
MWKLMLAHRSFFIRETVIAMVINALMCFAMTFVAFRSQTQIILWGSGGLFLDLIPTIFMPIFCMAVIITPTLRKRIEKGTAPRAPWQRRDHALLRLLPVASIFRAVIIGLCGLFLLLPITTGLLSLFKIFPLSLNEVLVFKICFGALMGVLITPFILIGAMADKGESPCRESEA